MQIFAGGTRGSGVIADPAFFQFGGDTTCFLIEGKGGEMIVVDAGSGLRGVEARLRQQAEGAPVLMLFTHGHLDHLIGLPRFSFLYRGKRAVAVSSPLLDGRDIQEIVRPILSKPFWPVAFEDLQSNLSCLTLPQTAGEGLCVEGLRYRWCALHHPGGCWAYRFDEHATGASAVIATDVEWAETDDAERQAFRDFCTDPAPPDVLIFDGQFMPAEYPHYKLWGHSRWTDAVQVAKQVEAKRLFITHHDPDRNDAQLEKIDTEVQDAMPAASLLRQGAVV